MFKSRSKGDTLAVPSSQPTVSSSRLEPDPSGSDTLYNRSGRIVPREWRRERFLAERWVGGTACVAKASITSTDLLVGVSFSAYSCHFVSRYSYENAEEALIALRDWDGRLDPPGRWIRALHTPGLEHHPSQVRQIAEIEKLEPLERA